jgi:hypothetical protein
MSWRRQYDLSGNDAASALTDLLGREVVWNELRTYEQGAGIPDTVTAENYAAVFGRGLAALLSYNGRDGNAPSVVPWPKRVPSDEEEKSLQAELGRRGYPAGLAHRFFDLGVSDRVARTWLQKFEPETAFEWLACRFGPAEAEKWHRAGYSVEEAAELKGLGRIPDEPPTKLERALLGLGAARPVAALWTYLELGEATALSWVDSEWDLLAAVPWILTGFQPAAARPWASSGFDACSAVVFSRCMGPDEARAWTVVDGGLEEWIRWRDCGFDPGSAGRWHRNGFKVSEGVDWRGAGISPEDAATWAESAMQPTEAALWSRVGLGPREAAAWAAARLTPGDVARWAEVSRDPAYVRRLLDEGVTPEQVSAWLAAGVPEIGVFDWEKEELTPDVAAAWPGSSPSRVRRLIARRIRPQQDRVRWDRARQRLEEARLGVRTARSAPTSRPSANPVDLDSGPTSLLRAPFPSVATCAACNRPIDFNARCGCS